MKVGLIGYKKPDIESLLQAYSIKQFLNDFNIDCCVTKKYAITTEDALNMKFQKEQIGVCDDSEVSTYLMINYKSFVDMTGSDAKYCDFYQRSFKTQDVMTEGLLLQGCDVYDRIVKPSKEEGAYLFLDCMSDRSPLVSTAQHYAKQHNLKLVARFEDHKYNRVQTVTFHEPGEYLGLLKGADIIMTDQFMTLFFAVLYNRKFLAQDCPALAGKNKRFVKELELMEHYQRKKELSLDGTFEIQDHKQVMEKLQILKEQAVQYLLGCLPSVANDCEIDAPPKIMYSECNGCSACQAVCPEQAITMVADATGFYYPQVNNRCTNCGLCEKTCVKLENSQIINHSESYPRAYSAINPNLEQRKDSAAGGVFPLIAEYIIKERHGKVAGVRYDDNMNAVYDLADNMRDVKRFLGMKYVKAQSNAIFLKVKNELESGVFVLFSGLPCECAGLKAYLGKTYENLFIIDHLCHSVSSPKVFKKYINYIGEKYNSKVTNVRFRDKSKGWLIHKSSITFEFEGRTPLTVNARRNNYFRNYMLNNLTMAGCSNCSYLVRNRVGDITLGDFWGIDKMDREMFDNNGTSLLLVNTKEGSQMLEQIQANLKMKQVTMGQAFKCHYKRPVELTKERKELFEKLDSEVIDNLLENYNDLK